MKVLTWNVNRAGVSRTRLWDFLEHEDADIILLQELTSIPERVRDRYRCLVVTPRFFEGHHAHFSTAVLAKGSIDASLGLESELNWVNSIQAESNGWILGCKVTLASGERFRVASIHSPAFPIPQDRWADGMPVASS